MPTTTDDDDVVFGLELGGAPGLRPVFVFSERVARQRDDGVFGHGSACCFGVTVTLVS